MKHGIYYAFWEQEWEADYLPYIKKVAKLGFDVLEIAATPLPEFSQAKLKELRQAALDHGVILSVGHGPSYEQNVASPDPEIRKNGIRFFSNIFERMELLGASMIGGGLYHYWPVNFDEPFDKEEDWKRGVESIKILAGKAKEHGVTMGMEVLNRFEGYLLNTAEEGTRFVQEIDEENVTVMLDTFHMNIEETSIGGAIRRAGKYLGHFHTGECNRTLPGTGRTPWREIRDALHDIAYDGMVVMEPFIKQGGRVGKDINVWRDLSNNASEQEMDMLAQRAVEFQRYMLD